MIVAQKLGSHNHDALSFEIHVVILFTFSLAYDMVAKSWAIYKLNHCNFCSGKIKTKTKKGKKNVSFYKCKA
jgi:uncharacterized membrane protein